MSVGNFFETQRKAHDLYTKTVTATYTTRAGGSSDGFIEDRIITITDPAASFTITVTNGSYSGQRLLIVLLSNASATTVTVDSADDDCTLDTAGDYISYEWIDSTSGWQEIHSEKAS